MKKKLSIIKKKITSIICNIRVGTPHSLTGDSGIIDGGGFFPFFFAGVDTILILCRATNSSCFEHSKSNRSIFKFPLDGSNNNTTDNTPNKITYI